MIVNSPINLTYLKQCWKLNNMIRKRRTYQHKGKIRFKYRIPRKLKKRKKIEFKKQYELRRDRLVNLYGASWLDHIVYGG